MCCLNLRRLRINNTLLNESERRDGNCVFVNHSTLFDSVSVQKLKFKMCRRQDENRFHNNNNENNYINSTENKENKSL